MKKSLAAVSACALFVSGCGGGSGTTTEFGFQNSNLAGTTYTGQGVTATRNIASFDTSASNVTVEFTPSSTGGTGADAYSSVAITIDGERHVLTPESANTATNASGDKALGFGASLNGGADTREMLF